MTVRVFLASIAAGLCWSMPQPPPEQQSVFRAETSLVEVPVSVQSGNTPVTDLRADDFTLTDNGVPQRIDAVRTDTFPIDVTLVVDVSGSTAAHLTRFQSDAAGIAQLLRPVDRLKILAFGTSVFEMYPMQMVNGPPPIEDLRTNGWSAVNDALAAALLRSPELRRRHLVVAFTDGEDNTSVLDGSTVFALAERSQTVLYVVFPRLGGALATASGLSPAGGYSEHARDALTKAADATGGRTHVQGPFSGSMVDGFKRVFDEFRLGYLLQYRPVGVSSSGWHSIAVRLARNGRYTIQAKNGYFAK